MVLLDLTMPVMSGEEAIDRIVAARPGVQVIVSTGYGQREAAARFSRKHVHGFLHKPYTSRQLADKIEALAGPAANRRYLALVTDHPQELVALLGVFGAFHTFGGAPSITPSTPRPCSLSAITTCTGIRGGAEDGADFRHVFDAAQYVDGITFAHRDHEDMARRERRRRCAPPMP